MVARLDQVRGMEQFARRTSVDADVAALDARLDVLETPSVQRLTSTPAAYAVATDTDMTLTVDEVINVWYDTTFHSEVTTSATAGTYLLALMRAGSQVGELFRLPASSNRVIDATITRQATASITGVVYLVRFVSGPVGGTVTLGASGPAPRTLKHRRA